MRAALLLTLAMACGDDGVEGSGEPPLLTIAISTPSLFRATSDVGIDCGGEGVACEVLLPAPADVLVVAGILRPQQCFNWAASVTPTDAGTCMAMGIRGRCELHIDRPVTVTVGGCFNP
jgi:hypothetical protein